MSRRRSLDASKLEDPHKATVILAELNERPEVVRRLRSLAGLREGEGMSLTDLAETWHLLARQAERYGRLVGAVDFEEAATRFMDGIEADDSAAIDWFERAGRRETIQRSQFPYDPPKKAPAKLRPQPRKESRRGDQAQDQR